MARADDRAVAAEADADTEIVAALAVAGEDLRLLGPDRSLSRKDIGRAPVVVAKNERRRAAVPGISTDDDRVVLDGYRGRAEVVVGVPIAGGELLLKVPVQGVLHALEDVGRTGIGAFRVVTQGADDRGIGSRMAAESGALSEIVAAVPTRWCNGDAMKDESLRIEL